MSSQTAIPLPSFFIGKDVTAARIYQYRANKHGLLSRDMGKDDTKCIWYSKEHLEKLLEEIRQVDGDGLRIFLGEYEADHPDFARQTCLLMVITKQVVNGNTISHKNVILEEEPGFGERFSLPRDIIMWGNGSDTKDRDFNHGSPCPPLCDGDGGEEYP